MTDLQSRLDKGDYYQAGRYIVPKQQIGTFNVLERQIDNSLVRWAECKSLEAALKLAYELFQIQIGNKMDVKQTETNTNKKVWTKEQIRDLIINNDKALIRGLLAIYRFQTAEEKAVKDTKENNNIGFNGVDAAILSSFVEFYNKTGFLSNKQMEIARKKMVKYSGQLLNIANNN